MSKYFLLYLLLFYEIASGQINLVPNPSFEDIQTCNFSVGSISKSYHWHDPVFTADLFSTCATYSNTSIPFNVFGYQSSHSGNNYAGIYNFCKLVDIDLIFFEYLQTRFTDNTTLIQGHKYYLEFYVSYSDTCCLVNKNIGARVTSDSINSTPYNQLIGPSVINNSSFISNKKDWIKLSSSFIANGDEKFLTIGNFKETTNEDTSRIANCNATSGVKFGSYYYIDDVSLYDVTMSAGKDTVMCDKPNYTLKVSGVFDKYAWSTGDSTQQITVSKSGTYWVKATLPNIGDFYDSVAVVFTQPPAFYLCSDTSFFEGTQLTLSVENSFQHYAWSNQEISPSITVSDSGIYTLTVYDYEACKTSKSVHVHTLPKPETPFIAPTSINQSTEKLIFTPINAYTCSIQKLTVYDALGKVIYVEDDYINTFPLTTLPLGIYYYRVDYNHQSYSSKLLVK